MKKTIFIAVLGMAACAATSYGQGYISFNSYSADQSAGAITTFGNGPLNGSPVPGTFTAELYYALGAVSSGFTALPSTITAYDASGDGYFQGGTATIPGYSSGAVSFEIFATGTYNSVVYSGFSAPFTESTIASSLSSPLTSFGDNGPGMPNFSVLAPVPEPTTLALAGLGGLASLVAIRRKKV